MLFPARRFRKESLGRDFAFVGKWMGSWLHEGIYMWVKCKNI